MTKARILIVEDDAAVLFGLEEVLRRDGYHVDSVDNGRDAISHITSTAYDLALLDLMMKDISGLEVLATIREKSPFTIAIILTGHASVDSAVEALRKGAHDYLFKPCDNTTLRESVRSGLARRQELLELHDTTETLKNIRSLLLTTPDLAGSMQAVQKEAAPEQVQPSKMAVSKAVEKGEDGRLSHGNLIVDQQRHTVIFDNKPLSFSPTEFQILVILLRQSPGVVDPQTLAAEALDYQIDESEARKIISYHIYRMRRKLQEAADGQEIIQTVRGVGYTIS